MRLKTARNHSKRRQQKFKFLIALPAVCPSYHFGAFPQSGNVLPQNGLEVSLNCGCYRGLKKICYKTHPFSVGANCVRPPLTGKEKPKLYCKTFHEFVGEALVPPAFKKTELLALCSPKTTSPYVLRSAAGFPWHIDHQYGRFPIWFDCCLFPLHCN